MLDISLHIQMKLLFTEESNFIDGGLEIKKGIFLQTHSYSLYKTLIDGLESYGLLIDYFYQLFRLSFWRHPFTADDPLVM